MQKPRSEPGLFYVQKVVHSRGFEPLTYSFGGCRSIQLSYECAKLV